MRSGGRLRQGDGDVAGGDVVECRELVGEAVFDLPTFNKMCGDDGTVSKASILAMADDDDIILSELNDEELVQQMWDDLYDGLKEEIEEGTNILLERGWAPYRVLTEALVGGM